MKKMIDGGTTVLFVSHDTFAVKNLCQRAFLVQAGKIIMDSTAKEVIETYRNMLTQSRRSESTEKSEQLETAMEQVRKTQEQYADKKNFLPIIEENLKLGKETFEKNATYQRMQDGRASFENIQLLNLNGDLISEVLFGQEVVLRMVVKFHEDAECLGMGYHIRNSTGIDLVYTDSRFNDIKAIFDAKRGEVYVIDWKFKVELRQELYDISCVISTPVDEDLSDANICDFVPCALQFTLVSQNPYTQLVGGYVHWHNDLKFAKLR